MKKSIIASIASLLCICSFAQQKPDYEAAARFSQKQIGAMVFSTSVQPNWFRDSDRFWYSWESPSGTEYYIVDPATGRKEKLFDMEKLAMEVTLATKDPFDAQHLPISGLQLKDDKYFIFDVTSKLSDPDSTFHFRYDIATKKLTQTEKEEKEYPMWASVSPDGKTGVFARNNNLYWMDAENMKKAAKDEKDSTIVEHRLTTDGIKDFGYGYGNYSGNTDSDTTKRTGVSMIAWSPDSKHFVTYKYDMRDLKELWVINSLSKPRPTLETFKYQMPGEPSPKEELMVFDMSDGSRKTIKNQVFKDQESEFIMKERDNKERYNKYRSRVWLGDNDGFYLLTRSRDLQRISYRRVDIAADSTKSILDEEMNTYIESRNLRFNKARTQFIVWSERNGWANLYLYKADGTLIRNLTDGPYHVEDILAFNEAEGYLLVSACGVNKNENPYQMHTYRVSLNGGPMKQLDMDDMDVDAQASDDGKYFVANYSRVDCPPQVALIDANGRRTELEVTDVSKLYEAGYKLPERFTVKAADGKTDLYGAIYKPFNFDPEKKYPIIEYVYPGPQVEANNISWSKSMLRIDRLAQIGFIVITVGNRGGHPNRSKWYHNYGYGNLRDYGLEDQKTAIQRLAAQYDWIDATRVGIHGHSGGGFMSTAAILKYPDFYKVAVSCAGNHDNSIYNRWWSEQHHGIQEKVTEKDTTFVYSIATNQQIASNLKGHLMLVHGDIDNNVSPSNTIRVVDALIKANKRFDLLILPGQRHGFGDMNEYFFYRMADYFSEWLLNDSNRGEVDIKELNND